MPINVAGESTRPEAPWIAAFFGILGLAALLFMQPSWGRWALAATLLLSAAVFALGGVYYAVQGPELARRVGGAFAEVDQEAGTIRLRCTYLQSYDITAERRAVRRVVFVREGEEAAPGICVDFLDRPRVWLPAAVGPAEGEELAADLARRIGCEMRVE